MSTVGSQTCVASCSNTRREVTADVSSTVENDLRLVFVDQLLHHLGISVSSEVFQQRVLDVYKRQPLDKIGAPIKSGAPIPL